MTDDINLLVEVNALTSEILQVREALFSSLNSMHIFEGGNCRVLDVFSGSGSVGLEALSRGTAPIAASNMRRFLY